MSRRCAIISTNKGLMTGNNVSKSNRKTRRVFLPNMQNISVVSTLLGKTFNLKVYVKTLRTITKHGDLDSYLLSAKANNLTKFARDIRKKLKSLTTHSAEKVAKYKKPNRSARLIKKVQKNTLAANAV